MDEIDKTNKTKIKIKIYFALPIFMISPDPSKIPIPNFDDFLYFLYFFKNKYKNKIK